MGNLENRKKYKTYSSKIHPVLNVWVSATPTALFTYVLHAPTTLSNPARNDRSYVRTCMYLHITCMWLACTYVYAHIHEEHRPPQNRYFTHGMKDHGHGWRWKGLWHRSKFASFPDVVMSFRLSLDPRLSQEIEGRHVCRWEAMRAGNMRQGMRKTNLVRKWRSVVGASLSPLYLKSSSGGWKHCRRRNIARNE